MTLKSRRIPSSRDQCQTLLWVIFRQGNQWGMSGVARNTGCVSFFADKTSKSAGRGTGHRRRGASNVAFCIGTDDVCRNGLKREETRVSETGFDYLDNEGSPEFFGYSWTIRRKRTDDPGQNGMTTEYDIDRVKQNVFVYPATYFVLIRLSLFTPPCLCI